MAYRRQRCPTRRSQLGFIMVGKGRAMMGKPFSVLDLFKAGEQGYWFDSSDLNSMFQESTGVTPAYAPGQGSADCPIGFRVDKRIGLVRGAELWADGSVTLTGASTKVSAGVYRVYSAAGVASAVNVPSTLVSGLWYEVTLTVDSITTAGTGIKLASTASTPTWTTTGAKRAIMLANATSASITINSGVATEYQVSGVSFKLLAGNHATQSVSGSRPTLSARYNLLTGSETLVGWGALGDASITDATHFHVGTTAGIWSSSALTLGGAVRYRVTATVSGTAGNKINLYLTDRGTVAKGGGTQVTLSATPTAYSFDVTTGAAVEAYSVLADPRSFVGVPAGTFSQDVMLTKVDVRLLDDAAKAIPAYQAVTTASTYDTAGFPWYLKCDGFDDGMVTNTIDFTATDKMTVWAGVTKLSDAAAAPLLELSATYNSNLGTFNVWTPGGTEATYRFGHSGNLTGQTRIASTFTAPTSNVLSCTWDAAQTPNISNKVTPRVNAATPTLAGANDSGTGNFGNYPMYLFRRGGSSLPALVRDYGQIVRGAASTAAQIADAERYLARNMGITI